MKTGIRLMSLKMDSDVQFWRDAWTVLILVSLIMNMTTTMIW